MFYADFKTIRQVNKYFRAIEGAESKKWPVNGRFNVTERAIRRVRREFRNFENIDPMEYALALECEITRIVSHSF